VAGGGGARWEGAEISGVGAVGGKCSIPYNLAKVGLVLVRIFLNPFNQRSLYV